MNTNNYLRSWTEALIANGRYSFALSEARQAHKDQGDEAVRSALKRLAGKGKIASVFNGYYIIIPPQYALRGTLPPPLFLDALMKHLKRNYYVSLLSAAAFYGAAQQQPQEYFVMTGVPQLRPVKKGGLKINFISIKNLPDSLMKKQKTEAGYLNISSAALTACDLIQYQRRIGGINRAAAVINELADSIVPVDFSEDFIGHCKTAALQRLGYIFEFVCKNRELSDGLYKALQKGKEDMFRVPLKAGVQAVRGSTNNRWRVMVNTEVDIES